MQGMEEDMRCHRQGEYFKKMTNSRVAPEKRQEGL